MKQNVRRAWVQRLSWCGWPTFLVAVALGSTSVWFWQLSWCLAQAPSPPSSSTGTCPTRWGHGLVMLVWGRKARLLGVLQFFVYSQLSLCGFEPETAAASCEEDWTWLIKVWSSHTPRYVTDAASCWQNTKSLMVEVLQCVCDCEHRKYEHKMYKATGR